MDTTNYLGNDTIMLQAFADGVVSGEWSEEQIKKAASKIGLDKATAILNVVSEIGNGSGEKELLENEEYSIIKKSIPSLYKNLYNYKEQADLATSDDNFSIGDVGIPAIGAGVIGGIYGISKGVGALRDYLPITNVKARDTSNWIRNITIGNYGDMPQQLDKRVNNFIEYIQNFSKDKLNDVAKKGYRGLYDNLKQDQQNIYDLREGILDEYADELITRDELLGDINNEIAKIQKTNPSRAKSLETVSKEYSKIFDIEAENAIKLLDETLPKGFKSKNKAKYDKIVESIYKKISIQLKQVEAIKEGAYQNFDNYDVKLGASQSDLQIGEGYRIIGKSAKKTIENHTNKNMIELNSQYGKLKEFEKNIGKLANKAQTSETYSLGRKVGGIGGEAVSKLPVVKSSWFPKLSNMAKEERILPTILERIRKWGDKMKFIKQEATPISSVLPEIEKASTALKKTSKLPVIGKTLAIGGVLLGALGAASSTMAENIEGKQKKGNTNIDKIINSQSPSILNTNITAPDNETLKAIDKYNKQISKLPQIDRIEAPIMSEGGESAIDFAVSTSPLAPVQIAIEGAKIMGKQDSLEELTKIERLKTKQKESSKVTTAGSVAQIPENIKTQVLSQKQKEALKKGINKKNSKIGDIGITKFGQTFGL